jgi:hypothetical protein
MLRRIGRRHYAQDNENRHRGHGKCKNACGRKGNRAESDSQCGSSSGKPSGSFLKKRTKKLFLLGVRLDRHLPELAKVFGSFFKKNAFLLPLAQSNNQNLTRT